MKFRECTPLYSEETTESSPFELDETLIDWVGVAERVTQSPCSPRDDEELWRTALIRDGFSCTITRQYDVVAMKIPSIEEDEILGRGGVLYTTCVQILPDSDYFEGHLIGNGSPQLTDNAAVVLKVLRNMGYIAQDLKGPGARSLPNVMTMTREVYEFFSRLELWFEPTTIKDNYTIQTIHQYIRVPKDCRLSSPNPAFLPLPSQQYLSLSATCAKVAHYSGARRYLEELDDVLEDLEGLELDS
ncbi:hypothetical protein VKT23_019796 [Stygiomarasmius scandens]|uniref:Uncharacterized protein n=1 Tax=Marasmiellus scandens TaxID=2682957 RepID=A0ABR1IPG5_9AGAR